MVAQGPCLLMDEETVLRLKSGLLQMTEHLRQDQTTLTRIINTIQIRPYQEELPRVRPHQLQPLLPRLLQLAKEMINHLHSSTGLTTKRILN